MPEATNAENELFGTERLLSVLNAESDRSLVEMLRDLRTEIDAFVGDAPQYDDITMLCLRYYGSNKQQQPDTAAQDDSAEAK